MEEIQERLICQKQNRKKRYNRKNQDIINQQKAEYDSLESTKKRRADRDAQRKAMVVKDKPSHRELLLKQFQRKIGEGWRYPCKSCERLFFRRSVQVQTSGNETTYLCFTCLKYLKRNKMPPMARRNNLGLDDIPPCLQLNQLEAVLIQRNILFIKLFLLPKTRWAAMKDRVVNIPIPSEEIQNSLDEITRYPRQLSDTGLVPVKLQRRKGNLSVYLHASVDVNKLIKGLKYIINKGHPGYQDITIDEHYTMVVPDSSSPRETSDSSSTTDSDNSTSESGSETEDDDRLNNVQDSQHEMSKATMMSNNYPEVTCYTKDTSEDNSSSIKIAPGEGKNPSNLMRSPTFLEDAFAHLFPSGQFSLNAEREVKLTKQQFMIQRLENIDSRFRDDEVFPFAATFFIERLQLEQVC